MSGDEGFSEEQTLIKICQKAPNCAGILHLVPMPKYFDTQNKTYFLSKNIEDNHFLKGDNVHVKISSDTIYQRIGEKL